MIEVPHLEWHITHNCNLSCQGCTHFTNHGHDWFADIKTLENWYSLWNKRISPKSMSILGGEPLLHKNVIDIIYLTKEMWKQPDNSFYEIVTNGILLNKQKHKDLPKALLDTNCTLSISIHSNDINEKKYSEKIKKSLDIVREFQNNYGIKVKIYNSFEFWLKAYKNFGINSKPFEDDNFEKSWDNCITGKQCFQLYNEKIYKCSLLAYLNLQKNKYGPLLSEKWDPYLKYVPLDPSCSDDDIVEFFSRGAESVCGMCPSDPKHFKKNDPMISKTYYDNLNKFKYSY